LIGLTPAVIARIKRRRIEQGAQRFAPLYQILSTMREFNITPAEWSTLGADVKRALNYFLIVEEFQQDLIRSKAELLRQQGQK